MSRVLMDLVAELNRGTLKVVDLTQPLGPDTPVIGLPAIFAASPGVTIDVISQCLFCSSSVNTDSVLTS